MKQVIFTISGEEFGIDIFNVEAIERSMPIIRIPTAPSHIAGLIHLRGEAIPVYDLRTRFGGESKPVELMIITKMRGTKVAIAVDNVTEIVEADDKEVITAPNLVRTAQTAFVSKVVNVKGHMFISLDMDGIATEEEIKAIEEMIRSQKGEN